MEFGVWNKTVFFVKGKNTFVVFYIGIDGEKAGGTVS
jgi:hypothetical protein